MVQYCPHCWSEIEEGTEHCSRCGRPVAEPEADFVDKLIAALRHPEPTRAGLAVHILGEMLREPRAIEPLIGLVRARPDAHVLKLAVQALGHLGDARAVPALVDLLEDPTAVVVARVAAVDALHQIDGEVANRALQQALHSERPSIRDAARRALQQNLKEQDLRGSPVE